MTFEEWWKFRKVVGDDNTKDTCRQVWEAATAAEREACAKVCEVIEDEAWAMWKAEANPIDQGRSIGADHCAAAIRAR